MLSLIALEVSVIEHIHLRRNKILLMTDHVIVLLVRDDVIKDSKV